MKQVVSPRVLGSVVVGLSLVFGAYTISNFGQPSAPANVAQEVSGVSPMTANQRQYIAVEDSDGNGLEDWRDDLVDNNSIAISTTNATYTPPDTLTGRVAIDLFAGYMESKVYAPVAKSNEEVVQTLSSSAINETFVQPYKQGDLNIIADWNEEDVVNYGNSLASAIESNSLPELRNELELIIEAFEDNDETKLSEIKLISNIYKSYRDDSLLVPTPEPLAKTHLDLINSYHAVQNDISGLTDYATDPLKTFIHIKSYRKNIEGLSLALENVALELEDYASSFKQDDPATYFILFNPDYNNFN